MPSTTQSLWPTKIGAKVVPAPVRILREQGLALSDLTNGVLYGEVSRSSLPSTGNVPYDFYIGVSDKPYRHKLLSTEIGLLSDFPATIRNYEEGITVQVESEAAFEAQIAGILQSDSTQNLLERLMAFAK